MRAKLTWYVAAIMLLALGLMTGCSRDSLQSAFSGHSNAQIATDVQKKINDNAALQNRAISIIAQDGIVTLSGTVESEHERAAAGNDAGQVEGVKTVVNNLTVSSSARNASAESAKPLEARNKPSAVRMARANPEPRPKTARAVHVNQTVKNNGEEHTLPANTNVDASTSANNPHVAAAIPAPAPAAPASPPKPITVNIPVGSNIAVRLIDALSSESNHEGDTFSGTLEASLLDDAGAVAIPANSEVEGRVVSVHPSTHFSGQSELVLQLDRITAGGKSYAITTSSWQRQGGARGTRTAETIGGGAVLGAIIGGIVGGGKGAGIGAGAGAAAGTGVRGVTHGEAIKLPSESHLDFRLDSELTVTAVSESSRPSLQ